MKRRTMKKREARRRRSLQQSIKRSNDVSWRCWDLAAMAAGEITHSATMARLHAVELQLRELRAKYGVPGDGVPAAPASATLATVEEVVTFEPGAALPPNLYPTLDMRITVGEIPQDYGPPDGNIKTAKENDDGNGS